MKFGCWQMLLGGAVAIFAATITPAAETADSSDRFSDTLRKLQERVAVLEEQDPLLQEQLEEKDSVESETSAVDDQAARSAVPGSIDELLEQSRAMEKRLLTLETDAKSQGEAAKKKKDEEAKKKEEDAKKDKKWFEKYTIRGYAQFRVNQVFDDNSARDRIM